MTVTSNSHSNKIKEATEAINKFNDAFNMAKDGENLNAVIESFGELFFPEALDAYSLVGSFFGLIASFTSSHSTPDMLDELGVKIDSFQSLMLGEFDHLEAKVELTAANATLAPAFAIVDSAGASFNSILETKDQNDRTLALKVFQKTYTQKNMRGVSSTIDQVIKHGLTQNNIYESNLDYSYGDAVSMNDIGRTLHFYMSAALLFEVMLIALNTIPEQQWGSIPFDKGENPFAQIPPEYINNLESQAKLSLDYHQNFINSNKTEWKNSLLDCKNKVKSYLNKYLETEVFPKLKSGDKELTHLIYKKITPRWGWLDFFAVTYNGVKGFDQHIVSGLDTQRSIHFREVIKNDKNKDKEKNIVVAWQDKEREPKGSSANTLVHFVNMEGEYEEGHAEEYIWGDLREVVKKLNPTSSAHRMIWITKRGNNAYYSNGNAKRLKWVGGKHLFIAIFE
jgi:hypothetical protein